MTEQKLEVVSVSNAFEDTPEGMAASGKPGDVARFF